MKRIVYSILTLVALAYVSCSPKEPELSEYDFEGTCWFDGYEYFVASTDTAASNQDLITFMGGTLHEGGSSFALRRIANDTFLVQAVDGSGGIVSVGVPGDTVVLDTTVSPYILVFHNPEDNECDTITCFSNDTTNVLKKYEQLLISKRLNALAGTYVDKKKNNTIQFVDTLMICTDSKGVSDTQSFHFFYSYEMPASILVFPTGNPIWYEFTANGLEFYRTKHWLEGIEDYTREARMAQLERIK